MATGQATRGALLFVCVNERGVGNPVGSGSGVGGGTQEERERPGKKSCPERRRRRQPSEAQGRHLASWLQEPWEALAARSALDAAAGASTVRAPGSSSLSRPALMGRAEKRAGRGGGRGRGDWGSSV